MVQLHVAGPSPSGRNAYFSPQYLLVDTMQHKTCCHNLLGCFDAWVSKSMDGIVPGYPSPWMALKTARHRARGTVGRKAPVEVSHSKVVSVFGMGRSASTNLMLAVRYACILASSCCACAILSRSRVEGLVDAPQGVG